MLYPSSLFNRASLVIDNERDLGQSRGGGSARLKRGTTARSNERRMPYVFYRTDTRNMWLSGCGVLVNKFGGGTSDLVPGSQ